MKPLTFVLEINCSHDAYSGPDHARITITQDIISYIKAAQKQLKILEASSITRWESPDEFLTTDDNEELKEVDLDNIDNRMDVQEFVVTTSSAYYHGCVKHTNMEWSSAWVDTEELFECWKIHKTPKKKLSLFLNNLKYDRSRDILRKRLAQ